MAKTVDFLQIGDNDWLNPNKQARVPAFETVNDPRRQAIRDKHRTKARLKAKVAKLRERLELVKYSPSQPRVPAGSPEGGQWRGNAMWGTGSRNRFREQEAEAATAAELSAQNDTATPEQVDHIMEAAENPDGEELRSEFPNVETARIIGEPTHDYNCFACAIGDEERWLWGPGHTHDVDEFDGFFENHGATTTEHVLNTDIEPEDGYEKVALWRDVDGDVTHFARQDHDDGKWISKAGAWYKIKHDLTELDGSSYGNVDRVYKIPKANFKDLKDDDFVNTQ